VVVGLEDLAHPAPPQELHDFVDTVEKLTRGENPIFAVNRWLARGDGMSPQIPHISIYILY